MALKRCNMPILTFAISVVIRGLSSCRVFTLWLYIWSFTQPQRKTSRGVRQDKEDATQLVYLFLSIDGGKSRSVTDSVSKMNRCPEEMHGSCCCWTAEELNLVTGAGINCLYRCPQNKYGPVADEPACAPHFSFGLPHSYSKCPLGSSLFQTSHLCWHVQRCEIWPQHWRQSDSKGNHDAKFLSTFLSHIAFWAVYKVL